MAASVMCSTVSLCSAPGVRSWTCGSMRPGKTRCGPSFFSRLEHCSILTILPSSMTMSRIRPSGNCTYLSLNMARLLSDDLGNMFDSLAVKNLQKPAVDVADHKWSLIDKAGENLHQARTCLHHRERSFSRPNPSDTDDGKSPTSFSVDISDNVERSRPQRISA